MGVRKRLRFPARRFHGAGCIKLDYCAAGGVAGAGVVAGAGDVAGAVCEPVVCGAAAGGVVASIAGPSWARCQNR